MIHNVMNDLTSVIAILGLFLDIGSLYFLPRLQGNLGYNLGYNRL